MAPRTAAHPRVRAGRHRGRPASAWGGTSAGRSAAGSAGSALSPAACAQTTGSCAPVQDAACQPCTAGASRPQAPTTKSLAPFRRMAPKRWDSAKGSRPLGTFWKALSGQEASHFIMAFWVPPDRFALQQAALGWQRAAGPRPGVLRRARAPLGALALQARNPAHAESVLGAREGQRGRRQEHQAEVGDQGHQYVGSHKVDLLHEALLPLAVLCGRLGEQADADLRAQRQPWALRSPAERLQALQHRTRAPRCRP